MLVRSPVKLAAVIMLTLTLAFGLLFWYPQSASAAGENVVIAANVVNIRSGPGTNYWIVTKVGLNEKFPVLDKSGDWYKIRLANGGSGWIAGWLVNLETPSYPGTPANSGKTAVIGGSPVNIRSGPGTGYSIITQVWSGQRYPVLDASGGWYKIQLSGGSGWVAGWLVNIETPPPQNPPPATSGGKLAVVSGSFVNIRSGPGTNNAILTQVSQGDKLPVAGQSGDWYNVTLPSGGTGWIAGWLVSIQEIPEPSRGVEREEPQSAQALSLKVSQSGNKTSTVVEADKPFDFKSFFLSNPDRFVVDMLGVAIGDLPLNTDVNSKSVYQVRAGHFQKDPDITRLVFDISSGAQYLASLSSDKMKLTVETYIPNTTVVSGAFKNKVIAIDPGHGGTEAGATGHSGTKEKAINLDVAKKVEKLLKAQGAKVIMTRTADSAIGLYERTDKANRSDADIFVSIHHNANDDRSYSGTSTYIFNGEGTTGQYTRIQESRRLARYVQTELIKALRLKDVGVKDANFVVLREPDMPAILCELAFITNPAEEKLMNTESYKDKAAQAIVKGIGIYLSEKRNA